MATGVVVGVGLLITVLSFFILLLSIFLMLQKNLKKLEDLLMLAIRLRRWHGPISCWRWG